MAKPKRVPLNRLVLPATFELVKLLADQLECSEGEVLDKAVEALGVVQSFGAEVLKPPQSVSLVTPQHQPSAPTLLTTGLRCNHCPERRYTGSKVMSICGGCQEAGHTGDPRHCRECANVSGTGAI